VDQPWLLATLGTMQKIVDANKQAVARVTHEGSAQLLKSDTEAVKRVRNAAMHPVKALSITEADFIQVRAAVKRLRDWVETARIDGSLAQEFIPGESELLASPASMGYVRA